ncbi:MAG: hypothetical protein Ct9H300mP28_24950 [Pseudomonadota bacterium]|nr:MAG: hypothetical protein Ct9H300mP28_24950 [Pseudomonadota bacterium]
MSTNVVDDVIGRRKKKRYLSAFLRPLLHKIYLKNVRWMIEERTENTKIPPTIGKKSSAFTKINIAETMLPNANAPRSPI